MKNPKWVDKLMRYTLILLSVELAAIIIARIVG